MRKYSVAIALLFLLQSLVAQELNTTVKINVQKLQTVDPKVFATLEQTVTEFMNSQKWTNDVYEQEERINCNILLTIQEELSPTSFKADLAIQASRPVYGSNYQTVIFNHIDREVAFPYEQFQPLIFSRNAFNDNLSAVLSFYAYIILGMDGDSFAPLGGESHLQTAQEIVNNVPPNATSAYKGWRGADGDRNRFWMIENLLSPRVRLFRQGMYDYHIKGLDIMSSNDTKGRQTIADVLQKVSEVNQSYPNSMIITMFNNTKSSEIIEIFKRGNIAEQDRVVQIMSRVDPANASKYRAIK